MFYRVCVILGENVFLLLNQKRRIAPKYLTQRKCLLFSDPFNTSNDTVNWSPTSQVNGSFVTPPSHQPEPRLPPPLQRRFTAHRHYTSPMSTPRGRVLDMCLSPVELMDDLDDWDDGCWPGNSETVPLDSQRVQELTLASRPQPDFCEDVNGEVKASLDPPTTTTMSAYTQKASWAKNKSCLGGTFYATGVEKKVDVVDVEKKLSVTDVEKKLIALNAENTPGTVDVKKISIYDHRLEANKGTCVLLTHAYQMRLNGQYYCHDCVYKE